MRNALIQGAKNLKLVVLEDKALMSEFVRVDWGGGGGGCNELKTAQSISRAREAYWNDT